MQEILAARERRAARQKELLEKYGTPLVCFTMNIPGPEKNSPLIEEAFQMGEQMLEAQFSVAGLWVAFIEKWYEPAGCVGFYAVEGNAERIKELTTEIEDASPLGRLFDMDVMDANGVKLARLNERKCLLCGESARVCGRSRAHGLDALVKRTREIMEHAVRKAEAQKIASFAAKALLFEVCTTPKPGLVDRINSGSHKDMDIFTFMSSEIGRAHV